MAERDRARSGRRRGVVLATLVGLLAVLLLVGGTWLWLDRGPHGPADPAREPAAVPPPRGLELPARGPAALVAAPLGGSAVAPDAVRRAVRRLAADPRMGRRVAVAVSGLAGEPVYASGPPAVVPASTTKLVTAAAALEMLGPEHRFATTVTRHGRTLTLVGGGDPLLTGRPAEADAYPSRADLTTLARRTAGELAESGVARVRLRYDDSLFTGPAVSPRWEDDYVPDDVVSPITALWVDEGREAPGRGERSADPAAAAAAAFARELRDHGVVVRGAPVPAAADGATEGASDGAAEVARVESAELVEIVQHVLEVSDNEGSEVLGRHVALAVGLPGSFAGVSKALPAVLDRLGARHEGVRLYDASGLSRHNRLPVATLLDVLARAAERDRPELSGVLTGLPVAGWSGSLAYRFTSRAAAGLGEVRAKTGTLTGVHGLAGMVVGADDTVMLFVAVADRVPVARTLFTRDRLDRIAAALAGCACAGATQG